MNTAISRPLPGNNRDSNNMTDVHGYFVSINKSSKKIKIFWERGHEYVVPPKEDGDKFCPSNFPRVWGSCWRDSLSSSAVALHKKFPPTGGGCNPKPGVYQLGLSGLCWRKISHQTIHRVLQISRIRRSHHDLVWGVTPPVAVRPSEDNGIFIASWLDVAWKLFDLRVYRKAEGRQKLKHTCCLIVAFQDYNLSSHRLCLSFCALPSSSEGLPNGREESWKFSKTCPFREDKFKELFQNTKKPPIFRRFRAKD